MEEKMKTLDVIAAVLLVIGGLNWGLVSVAHFDLVAAIFGMRFGETSTLSSVVYALVGMAALYQAVSFKAISASLGIRIGSGPRSLGEDGRRGENVSAFSPYFTWDENRNIQSRSPYHRAESRSAESRRRVCATGCSGHCVGYCRQA
jgi:uncharacterized protein